MTPGEVVLDLVLTLSATRRELEIWTLIAKTAVRHGGELHRQNRRLQGRNVALIEEIRRLNRERRERAA